MEIGTFITKWLGVTGGAERANYGQFINDLCSALDLPEPGVTKADVQDMPDAHCRFLIGFKRGEPDWTLLEIAGAEQLPAVQWNFLKLAKIQADKRDALASRLEAIFYPS